MDHPTKIVTRHGERRYECVCGKQFLIADLNGRVTAKCRYCKRNLVVEDRPDK